MKLRKTIGGGAVLDAVGFAAAIAHRGLRLVRLPTTTLGQADSGVGVKNGVNAFGKKNFLGTFTPPYAVLNDACFLTTLSERDWRSGILDRPARLHGDRGHRLKLRPPARRHQHDPDNSAGEPGKFRRAAL